MDVFGSFDFLHDVMLLDLLTGGHDMMPKYLSNLMYNQYISDDDNDDDDRVDTEMDVQIVSNLCKVSLYHMTTLHTRVTSV